MQKTRSDRLKNNQLQRQLVRLLTLAFLVGCFFVAYAIYKKPVAIRVLADKKTIEVSTPTPKLVGESGESIPAQHVALLPKMPQKAALMGRILMYHYVRTVDAQVDPLGFRLSVTASQLDSQLTYLQGVGYHLMTMQQFMTGTLDPKSVVLTFDDGYEDFYTTAYPILQKHKVQATVYIISGKMGGDYMTAAQLKDLYQAGYEIGAHTVDHRDLASLTTDQQHTEIFQSKAALEKIIGVPVTAFCYPSGEFNATSLDLVKKAGFTSATTTQPGAVHVGARAFMLPRIRIQPGINLATAFKNNA